MGVFLVFFSFMIIYFIYSLYRHLFSCIYLPIFILSHIFLFIGLYLHIEFDLIIHQLFPPD